MVNRYFAVALVFTIVAIGGVVGYGLEYLSEPVARWTFGVGFIGVCVTMIVAWTPSIQKRQ